MAIFAFFLGVLVTWLIMSGFLSQLTTLLLRIWWPSSRRERGIQADQWLLNSGVATSSGWRLLGYWRDTGDYSQACSELAGLMADKACLSNQDDVIDVGFTSHDQLLVWMDYYQVKSLTALAETEQLLISTQNLCGHFEQLKLERGNEFELARLPENACDKLLALDCAYHFESKPRFFESARLAIRTGGSLNITDMVLARPYRDRREQRFVSLLARICGISIDGLYPQQKYRDLLQKAGFDDIETVDISQDVLSGFCFWFNQHYTELSPVTRSRVWIRLRLLVWFIRWMQHQGLLEYHLITAK